MSSKRTQAHQEEEETKNTEDLFPSYSHRVLLNGRTQKKEHDHIAGAVLLIFTLQSMVAMVTDTSAGRQTFFIILSPW